MDATDLSSKYDANELQRKLREAGKNASVNQQKVNRLQKIILDMRGRKAIYEELIRVKKKELVEKNFEILKIAARRDETNSRLDSNIKKADNLRKQLGECSKVFSDAIKLTMKTAGASGYQNKVIQSSYTSAEMASLRGYSCKKGSTHSHVASKPGLK